MSGKKLALAAATIASEILSATGLAGGALLSEVMKAEIDRRRRVGTEILRKELESGPDGEVYFDEDEIEPAAAVFLRYSKALHDGAANRNLRILAQIIAGMKRHRAFDEDRFRRWAGIVEGLTRDELLLIGKAYALSVGFDWQQHESLKVYRDGLTSSLADAGYAKEEIEALFARVSSTGLFQIINGFGGTFHKPSPWLVELVVLAETAITDTGASTSAGI